MQVLPGRVGRTGMLLRLGLKAQKYIGVTRVRKPDKRSQLLGE